MFFFLVRRLHGEFSGLVPARGGLLGTAPRSCPAGRPRNRSKFLEFCRYLRSLHPADLRIAIVCENCEDHGVPQRTGA